jgi:hypothetical protein
MLDIGSGITAVLAALVTGGFTLAGVLLVTRSNRREAQSQRTWDVRKLCYTSVLAKLKDAAEAADVVDCGYHGEGGLGPHGYFGSSAHGQEEEAAVRAWASCLLEFNVNHLSMSDAFLARFERLLESLPTNRDEYDPPEEASRRAVCLRRAYRDLLPLAKHELFPS